MKCEQVQKEIMGEPLGSYSVEVDEHLRRCAVCEKLYLQVSALENSFRVHALIKPRFESAKNFYPVTLGLTLGLCLFLFFLGNQNDFVPMNIHMKPDSRQLVSNLDSAWSGIIGVEGIFDPWEELEDSSGQTMDQMLGLAAEEVFDIIHESHLEDYSAILETDETWDSIEYLEG